MVIRNLILDMGNVLLSWEPWAFAMRAAGNEQDAGILFGALFNTAEWHLHDAGQIEDGELLRISLLHTPLRLHDTLKHSLNSDPFRWLPFPERIPLPKKLGKPACGCTCCQTPVRVSPKRLKIRRFIHGLTA